MRSLGHLFSCGSLFLFTCIGGCSPSIYVPPVAAANSMPALDAVSPALGPTAGGIEISLEGRDFVAGAEVTVDGVSASRVEVTSAHRITALLPAMPGKRGPAAIKVTNPDGQTTAGRSDLFSYYASQIDFLNAAVSAGSRPFLLATGDFNHDDKLDLAVLNDESSAVNILLGNGVGGFDTPTSFAAGPQPRAIAAADFDGDENLDLVIANSGDDSVSILRGDGRGGFGAALSMNVGKAPLALAAGHFDDDEFLDLAVAASADDAVEIYAGNGTGNFMLRRRVPVGSAPAFIAADDVDGDRKIDLAVVNSGDGSVSVLLGDDAASFRAAMSYPVGKRPRALALADANGACAMPTITQVCPDESGMSRALR